MYLTIVSKSTPSPSFSPHMKTTKELANKRQHFAKESEKEEEGAK